MRSASARSVFVCAAVLAAGALVSGCRPGSALHGRYNNFRAYYNTYYNAERALASGEEALAQAAVTVDRGRLVQVFPTSSGQGGSFQEAIDKSADLLRERPDSKWADDALLIIGKAYFYQRNLAGAEQKFRETMTAAELADDRRLADEARFWLGRTYAASNRFDEGVAILEEGLASDGVNRRWAQRMQLALGELYARAERWDEAAETLRAGAADESDADVSARAYVLLGQVEEHAERYDEAAEAYRQALRRKPAYELAFAAEVGRALTLGLDAGQPEEALAIVRSMRRNDKHYQRRGELALVEARLRARAGDRDAALALFRDVLYEPELNGGSVRGEAHYRLGEFYRDQMGDYILASAHLDSAASSLRAPLDDRPIARGAVLDVADEARTYSGVATPARRIVEVDSLLALGRLPEDAFRTRIREIEEERIRVYLEEQRRLEAERRAREFSGTGGVDTGPESGNRSRPPTTDAGQTPPSGTPGSDTGFLSHRSLSSVQSGLITFQQRWGDRPLVPDWRRRAAIQAGDVTADRGVIGGDVQGGLGIGSGPPPLDLARVPRTPAKLDEMVVELAGLRYELANAFFLTLGRADTAAAIYRLILEETPDAPIAVRARYALAEIERAAGRDNVARPLYEAVAEQDTSALAQASRVRLGLEEPDLPETLEPSDETPAAYDAARARWKGGAPLAGAADLIRVGDANPDSPFAPRAYLAAAAAVIEWADGDLPLLRQPLPDSLVSTVLVAVETEPVAEPPAPGAAPPARRPNGGTPAPQVPNDELPRPPIDDEVPRRAIDDERPQLPLQRPTPPPAEIDDEPLPTPDEGLAGPPALEAPLPNAGSLAADSLMADSLAASSASEPAPSEPAPSPEAGAADAQPFTLADHLTAIAVRYTGTPYADRSTALADALAPPAVEADSTEETVPTPAVEEVGAPPAEEPVAASGLRSEDPVDPNEGGYSWNVQTLTIADEATSTVRVLRDAGFRVGVLQDEETGAIIIAIGQFSTPDEAREASEELPAWALLRGEIIDLSTYSSAVPSDAP